MQGIVVVSFSVAFKVQKTLNYCIKYSVLLKLVYNQKLKFSSHSLKYEKNKSSNTAVLRNRHHFPKAKPISVVLLNHVDSCASPHSNQTVSDRLSPRQCGDRSGNGTCVTDITRTGDTSLWDGTVRVCV